MRIIQFFDGAQSETTPTIGNIVASALVKYADDAAYEANEQGAPAKGNIYYNETDDIIRYYNGSVWQSLIDETTEQELTNKSMDGDLNTFTDISISSLKTVPADADKFIVRNALGEVISLKAVPVGAVVGTTDTQALTNKTIDADQNTITNISNDEIKSNAGIDATKLADGSVSNTEFQQLDGVTGNIQDQLDNKQEISEKGQPNGYASLDGGGKVPASQLPNTVMELQGFFNPNTTTLVDGVGNPGDIYEADTAGSHDFGSGSITFKIGDWAVYAADGLWHKSTNSNEVLTVAGKSGNVSLVLDDNTDVVLTTPVIGETLVYNGTEWVNQAPAAGVSVLDDLSDVDLTSNPPIINDVLTYDGAQWTPQPVASGSAITGSMIDYLGTSAPNGYIFASGKTIGSATSNATERANADTQNLYELLWNSYANSILPIQDSAGIPVARGASAVVDFVSNKRLTLPDLRGRVSAGKDDMGGSAANRLTSSGSGVNGATLGASGGAETHVLSEAQLASHQHIGRGRTADTGFPVSSAQGLATDSGLGINANPGPTGGTRVRPTTAAYDAAGGNQPHNNTQPTWVVNKIIKL